MSKLSKRMMVSLLSSSMLMTSLSLPTSVLAYSNDVTPSSITTSESDSFEGINVRYVDGKLRVSKDGYRLIVLDGELLPWPEDKPDPTPAEIKAMREDKGKFGLAIKAIKKGYSKIPASVKKYINEFIGLDAILGTLEHWTGAIEDGIYQICKDVGMPDWMAWTVAKTLTMISL